MKAEIVLAEAAEAMQKVKELGPCVFIGSSQTAFNERILLAGNFKTILAFNPSIPHCPIVSDVTRICLDHTSKLLSLCLSCSAQALKACCLRPKRPYVLKEIVQTC